MSWAAALVALASISAQKLIRRFFAAVEAFPVVLLVDRLFVPVGHIIAALEDCGQQPAVLRSGLAGSQADLKP
jgi:hypothetical protein